MSYRIIARNQYGKVFQLFGNNEYPEDFINELVRQGCKPDEDGCFVDFKIKELQPVIESMERYIYKTYLNLKDSYGSIFDISYVVDDFCKDTKYTIPMWKRIEIGIDNGFAFIIHNFINEFKDDIDMKSCLNMSIKEGHDIYISAG
jgi:hypothetical protein